MSLLKLFYTINYDLLMLFGRSILVPCHKLNIGYIALAETTSGAFTPILSYLYCRYNEKYKLIWIDVHFLFLRNMSFKMPFAKFRPLCSDPSSPFH